MMKLNKNIVDFFSICDTLFGFYIIQELMHFGKLETVPEKNETKLTLANRYFISCEISCGAEYLQKVIHGDLHSGNVLVGVGIKKNQITIKIGDFGESKIDTTSEVPTWTKDNLENFNSLLVVIYTNQNHRRIINKLVQQKIQFIENLEKPEEKPIEFNSPVNFIVLTNELIQEINKTISSSKKKSNICHFLEDVSKRDNN